MYTDGRQAGDLAGGYQGPSRPQPPTPSQAKGWSLEECAYEAGLHRTSVGDLEREARYPSISIIGKLAGALRVKAGQPLE
ncbi:helix-turn-helix domain-containing protein [Oleomonas cavernae]|uniref:helix-turn-helix domain-containing protein n=1 Tax=Oleomonas cavernae TaxID=2320859 RepID=UPI0038CFFA02